MRKTLLAALTVLSLFAGVVLVGCFPGVAGSGRLITKQYDLTGFTRIDAGNAFVVDISQSPSYGLTVTVDDNLAQYLDVSVSGSTLRLHLKPSTSISRATLRATVTLPSLDGLSLSGAVRGSVTGFNSTGALSIGLSGASVLSGDLASGDTQLTATGASRATLSGSAGNLVLNESGASNTDLGNWSVRDARANLSGASRAIVNASGRLDVDLSGASTLEYTGSPSLGTVNTSGGSTLRRR